MSRPPIFVNDLEIGCQVWKMSIRIIDLWTVKERNGKLHVELIIQDAKGQQIQVVTRPREYNHWMQVLTEHDTYTLYNGEPLKNDIQLKACDNPVKLMFNQATTLYKNPQHNIPPHKFDFKPIPDFISGIFKHDMLYDVIGIFNEVIRKQTAGNCKKACANILLSDYHGNVIEVVLWDSFASKLFDFLNSNSNATPIIIVLTHGWCKRSADLCFYTTKSTLSNAWNGSKLLINYDHPQVHDYRTKLGDYKPCPLASQSVSQTYEYDKFWTNSEEFKSISEIKGKNQDCFATTIGTTVRFKPAASGWYYNCCSGCSRAIKDPELPFQCNCGGPNVVEVTKYKLEIEVEHGGIECTFMFWDKDCVPIVGMTAGKLRAIMKEAGEDHPQIYPTYLDVLLEKKLTFRVKYTTNFGQCSIVQINPDEQVYKRIDEFLNPDEHTSKVPVTQNINSADMKTPTVAVVDNSKVTELPAENVVAAKSNPALPISPINLNSKLATEVTLSGTSSTNTPMKRDAAAIVLEDATPIKYLTPQNSATKVKHMKTE